MNTAQPMDHHSPARHSLTSVLAFLMLGVLLWLFHFLDSSHFQTVAFFFEDGHLAALNAFGAHHSLA